MPKKSTAGRGKDKVYFNFQVEKSLKDTFLRVCENNDMTASQVMRRLMKQYINENTQGGLIS